MITFDDLIKLDYSYMGLPFVDISLNRDVSSNSLDHSYMGTPFWGISKSLVIFRRFFGNLYQRIGTRTVK